MKIDRALIIRRLQVPLSIEYAQMCADSCEEHNLPYEFIDAVEFMSCEEAFESVGTFKHPDYEKNSNHKDGINDPHCNIHASHIKCWKRIVELDKPCIILEHDSIVKGNVRGIDIFDDTITTFGHRVSMLDSYVPPSPAKKLVKIKRAVGAHAYGITSKTAKDILNEIKINGIVQCVDQWLIMKTTSGLPLYVCEPPQVVCWPRISTRNFTNRETGDDILADKYRSSYVVERDSLTPGWRKGIR